MRKCYLLFLCLKTYKENNGSRCCHFQPSGMLMYLDSEDEVPTIEDDKINIRDNVKIAVVRIFIIPNGVYCFHICPSVFLPVRNILFPYHHVETLMEFHQILQTFISI